MHLHFILDEPQYNFIFENLIAEARKRRHVVSISRRWNTRYDADVYIGLQGAAMRACPRPFVMIWHGLGLAKNTGFNLDADLVLLPSEALHDILRERLVGRAEGGKATIASGVGSSKIDLLLQHKARREEIRDRMRAAYKFDGRPIVVLCPTWRHSGNQPHAQRNYRLREAEAALERDFNVIVLHHSLECDPTEVDELHFRIDPSISRIDHFVAADCAISDTSGLSFELAAIDVPVVLLDNPDDPNFLLVRMLQTPVLLDLGPASALPDLSHTVAATIADPQAFAERRAHWGRMALGPCDGRSAERVLDAISSFTHANYERFAKHADEPELLIDYLAKKMAGFRTDPPLLVRDGVARAALPAGKRSVMFGPYQRLGPGHFFLDVDIEVSGDGKFSLQIDGNGARTILALREFSGALNDKIEFEVPPELTGFGLEYRLRQPAGATGSVVIRRFRLYFRGLSGTVSVQDQ